MEEKLYSVEQIAKLLEMHPKTVRNYIRTGRLRAHKVGKEWRVTGHDLSVFVEDGRTPAEPGGDAVIDETTAPEVSEGSPGSHKVMVSAVVDIAVAGKDEYMRLSNTLLAVLTADDPNRGRSTINMRYFERERRLKVMLWGTPTFVEGMIGVVAAMTGE